MAPGRWLCLLISTVVLAGFLALPARAQPMPREDVVDVPAIGEGLCVSNVFQANMVLQRDKPINVWGWAAPGEEVTVEFSGISSPGTVQFNIIPFILHFSQPSQDFALLSLVPLVQV